MTRKKEQLLWDRMRNNLGGKLRLQRVEEMLGSGTPDVLALRAGKVTWCETKAAKAVPKRPGTPLLGEAEGLTIDQRNWHLDWTMNGGRSMIIVGVKDHRFHAAIWGMHADRVNAASIGELRSMALVTWEGPEFWKLLLEHL